MEFPSLFFAKIQITVDRKISSGVYSVGAAPRGRPQNFSDAADV
jgi:hypothetical protein